MAPRPSPSPALDVASAPLAGAVIDDHFGAIPTTAAEVGLDPEDWDAMRALGHTMVDDMVALLASVRARPAWQPVPTAVRESLAAPLPRTATSAADVYEQFRTTIQPYPTGNIHPRFWGWVMGTGSISGAFAELLAATLDSNAVGGDQGSTYVEMQVLQWLRELLGVSADASGILVSGGSVANLVGLTAARQAHAGLDAEGHGVAGQLRRPVLYCSTETHNSVAKAVAMLGLGAKGVRSVPVHGDYSVDVDAMREMIRSDRAAGLHPFCIVGNAGTVNTGAFDDLDALADLAVEEGCWLHVDGAFGAFAAVSESAKQFTVGMERADSLAVDLHKWMHMPYDVGCTFVRDRAMHHASFAQSASYLDPQARGFAAGSHWFAAYGPQLSRGNRALKVWMELKTHGTERYARLVDQNIAQARHLADLVQATDGFELAAPAPLNVVCLRMTIPGATRDAENAANQELLLRIQERGVALPSSTVLQGTYVIRVAITNHRTRLADLDLFMAAATELAAPLRVRAADGSHG